MTRPLDAASSVELAVVERSGLVESRHLGAAVVLDGNGTLLRSLGGPDAVIYPRSSLKPLQALTVLRTGVTLDPPQAALATASHAGTTRHLDVVRSMLSGAGLDEAALQCPADWPGDASARQAARVGSGKSALAMNCSGKHAAFLMACVHHGWPVGSYLDPAHPLQQQIRQTVEQLTGEQIPHSGVDGCGAPVHAVTLRGLARALSLVTGPAADADARYLSASIRANGWAIDGPGRANTVAIEQLDIVAKGGAEGVMVMSTNEGVSVALKVLDGSGRAATLVALELLVDAGAVSREGADRVIAQTLEPVLGRGEVVGAVRVSFPR